MNMKRLLSLVALFATLQASAQQVNPVPDYVFRNQMSVGRGTVTDTAAYFSIGPRYGATRGMMPPMVVDTASFSGNKRNGLLIFSVQKNKFLYWDSVGVKWAEMAGTGGTAISSGDTAAMLSPYVRHAGYGLTKSGQSFFVDTLNISTRAWRQKGLDSLAVLEVSGSGTTNYIPKFTGTTTIGNSQIFENATNIGIGTITPYEKLQINKTSSGKIGMLLTNSTTGSNISDGYFIGIDDRNAYMYVYDSLDFQIATKDSVRFWVQAATGNIGIATTIPSEKLHVVGRGRFTIIDSTASPINILTSTSSGVIQKTSISAAGGVTGTGTTNYISKFSSSGVIANSQLIDNGTSLAIGTTPSTYTGFGAPVIEMSSGGTIIAQGSVTLGSNFYYVAPNLVYKGTGVPASYLIQVGGSFRFYNAPSGTAGNAITFTQAMTFNDASELLVNTTSDVGDFKLQVNGNALISGNIRTAAPAGGTANDWRLGTVATVSPTSPNRTIEVSIGGTIYYIHAKTTND
jgi:hypothetical protein